MPSHEMLHFHLKVHQNALMELTALTPNWISLAEVGAGRLKMQDWKMRHQNAGVENAGLENARPGLAGKVRSTASVLN